MTDTSGDELLAQKWADYFEGAPDDHAAVAINIPAQRAEIVSALRIAAQRPSPSGDGLRDAAETALKFIESQMSYSQPAHDMGEEPSDQFTYDAVPVVMDLQKALVPTDTFDLHSYTRDLVSRFATALSEKLSRSEKKYGYSDNWADPTWQAECQKEFRQHVAKGDPIDVAAFCAFMWHHGWPIVATTTPSDNGVPANGNRVNTMVMQIVNFTCAEQYDLAFKIAENVGYVLTQEPEHPDSHHANGVPARSTFLGYRNRNGAEMHCSKPKCVDDTACQDGCVHPVAVPEGKI